MIIGGLVVFKTVSVANGSPLANVNLVDAQLYVEPAPIVRPVTGTPVNTTNSASIDAIQAQILAANPRALKLPNLMRRRTETLEQFLIKFLTIWNNDDQDEITPRATIYADDDSVQTEVGKRRSIGDLFMICRYYYPTCTLKQVASLLYQSLFNSISPGYRSSICTTIHKRTFYYDQEDVNGAYDKSTVDEYGKNWSWWITELNRN